MNTLKDICDKLQLKEGYGFFSLFDDKWKGQKGGALSQQVEEIIEKKLKPTAIFVSQKVPLILFFDFTKHLDKQREKELHKQLWSFDGTPLVFIIKPNDIEIYNAFKYEREQEKLAKIEIQDEKELIDNFSFWKLQSGQTWKEKQIEKFYTKQKKERVHQRLFDNIKTATNKLIETGLAAEQANILILRLIFVRYLIDRGVQLPQKFIQGKTILEKRQHFSRLIANAEQLNTFFEYLNKQFKGVLFTPIDFNKKHTAYLSDIFDARKDKKTALLFKDFYFDIFDFSIIPIEIISGIYESMIDEQKRKSTAAIYTPPFLVEYILSQTIDPFFEKNLSKTTCKIFDPACGSGIFLVQAYRRMVEREKALKGKIVSSQRLRKIAEDNLFGIDINPQALLIASFSIYIAILDYKEPKAINGFHFPTLINTNLIKADFFDETLLDKTILKKVAFDFILGNPPWKSEKKRRKEVNFHEKWLQKHNVTIGHSEVSESFLLRTKNFISENTATKCVLIVTSTNFYKNSATNKKWKAYFLKNVLIEQFFDISIPSLLGQIFHSKTPASIVFYTWPTSKSNLTIKTNNIKFISLKLNHFFRYFKAIVIEKFDTKEIAQQHFIENDWLFKVALYGNTLDFFFLKGLLSNKKNISAVISSHKERNPKNKVDKKLHGGVGPKKGSNLIERFIGRKLIENKNIGQYYSYSTNSKKLTEEDVYFESARHELLFEGTQVLLKIQTLNHTEIVVSYTDKPLVFRDDVYGISTTQDISLLKTLYATFVADIFTYFLYLTSTAWGIGTRKSIKTYSYLAFPFIEIKEDTRFELVTLVDKFLVPFQEQANSELKFKKPLVSKEILQQINQIVNELYGVNQIEKDLIDYVLKVARYQFQPTKQQRFLRKVQLTDLEKYVAVFERELGDLFAEDEEYLQGEIYLLSSFVAINFVLVSEKPEQFIHFVKENTTEKKVLKALSDNLTIWDITKHESNLYLQKDIKGFEENSFYIIKPNEYKCWHPALAWYDVGEVKEAIQVAEIELLNEIN